MHYNWYLQFIVASFLFIVLSVWCAYIITHLEFQSIDSVFVPKAIVKEQHETIKTTYSKSIAWYSFFPVGGFILIYLLHFSDLNRINSRVYALIGTILSLALLAWAVLMYNSPTHISYDEIFWAWIIYGVLNILLFYILYLKSKQFYVESESDILDSFLSNNQRK